MESPKSRCPGCGAELPGGALPYRGYYNCSPECWSAYTKVLGVEYQNPELFARVHQLTVDAYAVQHAGGPHPDKSVCVHLVGLHLALERQADPLDVPGRLQRLAASTPAWPHFELPVSRAALTARDLAQAPSLAEHANLARAWAEQVWSSWKQNHAAIETLAEGCFARSRA